MFRKFFAACAVLLAVGTAAGSASAQTVTTYATFAFNPSGGVFDMAGDYYVAGTTGQIYKVTGAGAVVTSYGTYPGGTANGMAFNAAGDLVFSVENGGIYRYPAGCVTPCAPVLVANTPGINPQEIAYDAAGNLYIATWGSNSVLRLAAGCVEPCTPTVHASGGPIDGSPFGLAISPAGIIYLLEDGGDVLSVPTSCVAPCTVTPVTTIPGGAVAGRGLTFDGAGVLYGQAASQSAIYQIPVDGSAPTSYATDPGFAFPYGFSTGPDGALYSADIGALRTFRITAAPFVPTVTVPTLSEWAMILFGVMLAGGAAVLVQRRRLAA